LQRALTIRPGGCVPPKRLNERTAKTKINTTTTEDVLRNFEFIVFLSPCNLPYNTRSQIALSAPTLGASEVFDQWMKAGTWLK